MGLGERRILTASENSSLVWPVSPPRAGARAPVCVHLYQTHTIRLAQHLRVGRNLTGSRNNELVNIVPTTLFQGIDVEDLEAVIAVDQFELTDESISVRDEHGHPVGNRDGVESRVTMLAGERTDRVREGIERETGPLNCEGGDMCRPRGIRSRVVNTDWGQARRVSKHTLPNSN